MDASVLMASIYPLLRKRTPEFYCLSDLFTQLITYPLTISVPTFQAKPGKMDAKKPNPRRNQTFIDYFHKPSRKGGMVQAMLCGKDGLFFLSPAPVGRLGTQPPARRAYAPEGDLRENCFF